MRGNSEENLRPKESRGRSLPKPGELRCPRKITRRGHCESYKDTEAAIVRPHNNDGRRKIVKKVTESKPDFRKRKTEKSMGGQVVEDTER